MRIVIHVDDEIYNLIQDIKIKCEMEPEEFIHRCLAIMSEKLESKTPPQLRSRLPGDRFYEISISITKPQLSELRYMCNTVLQSKTQIILAAIDNYKHEVARIPTKRRSPRPV
jgi:hypothetical protein